MNLDKETEIRLLKSDLSIMTAYMESIRAEIKKLEIQIENLMLENINLRKALREYDGS